MAIKNGTSGPDVLIGTAFADTLNGLGDGDTLVGLAGNDILNGDAVTGPQGPDTLIGGPGNDTLYGRGGDDWLIGGTGNDILDGGTGIDVADYSNRSINGQSYIGATAGVTVNLNLTGPQNTGGSGVDTLVSIENVSGTNFNDRLTGNGGSNLLAGLGGNDTLIGGAGNDTLNGGSGNDRLDGGTGIDTANYSAATAGVTVNLNLMGAQNTGGAGIDTLVSIENLTGSNFNDRLTGNGGSNLLAGLGGNDTLIGGAGNDTLNGGSGNDRLDGGTGTDTADYSTATAGVTVNLNLTGAQNTGGAGIDTLVSIENLTGSNFNDTLRGFGSDFGPLANNRLDGGAGNDTLHGGNRSTNTLYGGAGNDKLHAGLFSEDTLFGGAGDDTLFGGDELGGEQTLYGETGNDTLIASLGTLYGGAGDDVLEGFEEGTGGGTMYGGTGNDLLTVEGTDNHWTVNGDSGIDQLTAIGSGGFRLNGGAGADILKYVQDGPITGGTSFDYNSVSDSNASTGRDTIINFTGEGAEFGNVIDLRDIDANNLVSGNQAFTWIGSAAFTAAGQLRYAGGILQGSTDTDTAAEFEVQLLGAPALTVGGVGTDVLL